MEATADGFAWDAALALVRWQQTRRGYDGDEQLLRTGFSLLAADADGQFGPQSALSRAERAFNLSWQRVASEVLQFAVFLVTKAKRDDEQRPLQTRHALRLLQLALTAFAVKGRGGDTQLTSLPLNSCNLLLSTLAETLEKTAEGSSDELQSLLDVKGIFLYLFGLSDELTTANFQMYRPPTNVFAEFLKRALTASFRSLTALQQQTVDAQTGDKTKAYVDLVHAAVFVFQELQKTQTNKKKVFLAIAKTSLRDIIAYRHALVTLETQSVPGVGAITALLDRVVEDALFDAEHIRQYDGALVHASIWQQAGDVVNAPLASREDGSKTKKQRKAGGARAASGLLSYQKNLFDELRSFLSDVEAQPEVRASAGGLLEVLVRGFATRIRAAAHSKIEDTKTDLKTTRKRAAIVIATTSTAYSPFKFWSELCAVTYLAFQQQQKQQDSEAMPVLVTLYNALFRALCECDVYRVTEDTEEREQFQTMEKVLSSFMELVNVEKSEAASTGAQQAVEECQVVSSAVRCSPNLVNCCLVPIFELLGAQAVRYRPRNGHGNAEVVKAASGAVVELIRAYDSMRLLDTFLQSAFAIQRASDGLYVLFMLPQCDAILRKAFMALPPGQVEVLWSLFVNQIASYASVVSEADSRDTHEVALVRLLFQTFLQEVHVVPQNRTKVVALVSQTHQKLLLPLAEQLTLASKPITPYQRELVCVFGELLMFDSVLSSSMRAQTFGVLFERLAGNRFVSLMEELLSIETSSQTRKPSPKKKSKKAAKTGSAVGTDSGLGAAGIINLCVHWLQKAAVRRDSEVEQTDFVVAEATREERERVTRLVLEYVIEWKCWDAVTFHLPELVASASDDECERFFREIVRAFVNEAVASDLDGPAKRMLCDAGFYEIPSLRSAAPRALAAVGGDYLVELELEPLKDMVMVGHLFSLLSSFPSGYLKPAECGKLLTVALSLNTMISMSTLRSGNAEDPRKMLLTWIQTHFQAIGSEIYKSKDVQPQSEVLLRDGARFILARVGDVDKTVSIPLVAEVLGFYAGVGANEFVGELLSGVLASVKSEDKQKQPADERSRDLRRAATVVEALAACRSNAKAPSKEEKDFIDRVVDLMERQKLCQAFDKPLAFEMLNALLKYHSGAHSETSKAKQQSEKQASAHRRSQLLITHVGTALAASMKLIVANSDAPCDPELRQAAWSVFVNFCDEFPSFRSFVTPLETYGCLLAVALTLVSSSAMESAPQQQKAGQPLQALVLNANRDEFRLLLATIVQELAAPEGRRKVSALRALCLLLSGDRKLSASRRQHLNERKEAIVEGLLQNFTLQLLPMSVEDTKTAELSVWNLQAFVLVFCKAELFTWKTHELQHVFTGFQPLLAVVACWQSGRNAYTSQQLHQLWTLSYTLLLRLVRHHFASLVNGIPHLVQAANALLQLLVLASSTSEDSPNCVEWSSNLARLYGYMKEHDTQLRKHVVYLLMTFLLGVTRDQLPVRLQQKLRPGVFALLDVCSPYEKEQLYAALDSTGKSLLKTLDTNYKLTHRYVGKV
ncbi:hypothetical protein BBJ28_00016339 [Nothophytophthora sp. Chile5]|nr:hypothetical protein BBJ28_00016339 [Nothophytophthora sp. Chile5]